MAAISLTGQWCRIEQATGEHRIRRRAFHKRGYATGTVARAIATASLFAAGTWALARHHPLIVAQARALAAVCTTLELPALAGFVALASGEPRVTESAVAGVETRVFRPARRGPRPTLVLVNGATPLGQEEPGIARLADGLARTGFQVFVPDLPGLREGRISARTMRSTVRVARAAGADTGGGRVGLVGVSVGATLALLAAGEPELEDHLTVVAGLAPYTDVRNAILLATTGTYWNGHEFVPYSSRPYLTLIIAHSLTDQLSGSDRENLLACLPPIEEYHPPEDEAPDPLAALREVPEEEVSPEAWPLIEVLANRNPRRFDRLYGRLPPEIRTNLQRLSPVVAARGVRASVELATGPDDEYFPAYESRRYARLAANARATVTPTLSHAGAEISLRELRGALDFNGFVVRTLLEAAR